MPFKKFSAKIEFISYNLPILPKNIEWEYGTCAIQKREYGTCAIQHNEATKAASPLAELQALPKVKRWRDLAVLLTLSHQYSPF